MINASYYPDDYNRYGTMADSTHSRTGCKCTRDAMVWIFNDAISKYDISSPWPLHGFWFWYKLEKNGKELGYGNYLIRPLLTGKNKGKPAMFRWNRHNNGLYRIKSKAL